MSESLPSEEGAVPIKKKKQALTVLEAVDHLSNLAELDISSQEQKAWADPENSTLNQKKIKETFQTINTYLHHLYQKERAQLRDLNVQIGIQAMMQLAKEAVTKVEKFTEIFKGITQKGGEIPEYQQLQQFYLSKIVTKLKKTKGEEHIPPSGEILSHTDEIELEKQAIRDLESVRQDTDYELFYIHKEDGMPFFNENLERHIRLVGRFDQSFSSEERDNIMERMRVALDRDYHDSAQEMLNVVDPYLEDFYKEALRYKNNDMVSALNKGLMALMLAANPKNLIHNTTGEKSCLHYFIDFQRYLREALSSDEYVQLLYIELAKDPPFFLETKKLAHRLCGLLFLRVGAQQASLDLIKSLFKNQEIKFSSMWATLTAIDEAIRSELSYYPSGPLLEILESLDKKKDKGQFDPILQKNAPFQFFSISSETIHTTFLHLPSPTVQEFIDKARVVPEFVGYLHYLGEKKHLLINLQDLTSWKDYARSLSLEELSKEKKFENNFLLISFPKDTDFYHQQNEYGHLNESLFFKESLKEQISSGKPCGFYFPTGFDIQKEIFSFIDFIHEYFYESKADLSRKERQDFIEIFYFFSCLLIIEKARPDTVSFTSKDGIDTGSTATASFFGFAKLLSGEGPWTDQEKQFFLFSFYKAAAFVRHRAPLWQRVQRAISALEHFEKVFKSQRETILKACAKLFPDIPLHKFMINNVA
jgi:hypothetical protein